MQCGRGHGCESTGSGWGQKTCTWEMRQLSEILFLVES